MWRRGSSRFVLILETVMFEITTVPSLYLVISTTSFT